MEPSFVSQVIDAMVPVPDAASVAAMRFLSERLGRRVGGSTGTNFWGACTLIGEMAAAGRGGSVATLLCDSGDRYDHTYFNDDWVAERELDLGPPTVALEQFYATGVFSPTSS